jgi:hypothetical protein
MIDILKPLATEMLRISEFARQAGEPAAQGEERSGLRLSDFSIRGLGNW